MFKKPICTDRSTALGKGDTNAGRSPSRHAPNIGISVPLIVWHRYGGRTRSDIAQFIRGPDRDHVRSAVLIISVPRGNQWNPKRVAASRAQGDTASWLDLAILVGYRISRPAGRNGLRTEGNVSRYSDHNRFAVRWPQASRSHRTANAGRRLRDAVNARYCYPASPATWIDWLVIACRDNATRGSIKIALPCPRNSSIDGCSVNPYAGDTYQFRCELQNRASTYRTDAVSRRASRQARIRRVILKQ